MYPYVSIILLQNNKGIGSAYVLNKLSVISKILHSLSHITLLAAPLPVFSSETLLFFNVCHSDGTLNMFYWRIIFRKFFPLLFKVKWNGKNYKKKKERKWEKGSRVANFVYYCVSNEWDRIILNNSAREKPHWWIL